MSNDPLPKWPIITAQAKRFGAKDVAVAKWRSRGVPYRWQLLMIRESGGLLSVTDFQRPSQETAA